MIDSAVRVETRSFGRRLFAEQNAVRYQKIQDAAQRVLSGDASAKAVLDQSNVAWKLTVSDPQTWRMTTLDESFKGFGRALDYLDLDIHQKGVCYNTSIHFEVNSEHIAPLPVLTLAFVSGQYLFLQSHDLGQGLGKYLDNIGWSFSTRPYARQLLFSQDDQGNGLLLAIYQALAGCNGRGLIESSGKEIFLAPFVKDEFFGVRTPSPRLAGTAISLALPLGTTWQQTCCDNPHDLFRAPLKIRYLVDIK